MSGDEVVVAFKHRVPNPTDWLMVPLLPSYDSTPPFCDHLAATRPMVYETPKPPFTTPGRGPIREEKEAPNISVLKFTR